MPKPPDHEKIVDRLHAAARAYIEAGGGSAWVVGPIRVVVHKAKSYDLVIEIVGDPPPKLGPLT